MHSCMCMLEPACPLPMASNSPVYSSLMQLPGLPESDGQQQPHANAKAQELVGLLVGLRLQAGLGPLCCSILQAQP